MKGLERDGRGLGNAEEDFVPGVGIEFAGQGGGKDDLGGRPGGRPRTRGSAPLDPIDLYGGGP
jgi:hypothetical protein